MPLKRRSRNRPSQDRTDTRDTQKTIGPYIYICPYIYAYMHIYIYMLGTQKEAGGTPTLMFSSFSCSLHSYMDVSSDLVECYDYPSLISFKIDLFTSLCKFLYLVHQQSALFISTLHSKIFIMLPATCMFESRSLSNSLKNNYIIW